MVNIDFILAEVFGFFMSAVEYFTLNSIKLHRPDEEMLNALYTMISQDNINSDPILILAPTAVVHTFCRNHNNCNENESVQKFVKYLERNVELYMKKDLSVRANREKVKS